MKTSLKWIRVAIATLLCLAACFVLAACNEGGDGVPPGVVHTGGDGGTNQPETDPNFTRTPPPVAMPEYVGTNQVAQDDGTGQVGLIDITNANDGYVAVQLTASVDAKFRITNNDTGGKYIYWLDNDGTMNFFPITYGNGNYTYEIFTHIEGDSYYPFLTHSGSVTLTSELAPYLIPTKLVRYDESSNCVQGSYEIAEHSPTDLAVAESIFEWVTKNVTYDDAKAEEYGGTTLRYEPFPDDTYASKTGICYDYASLTAAMFRANGIPTKLIIGEVLDPQGNIIKHAWNMVWSEEEGWIAADLAVAPNDWSRIDATFYATGGSGASKWVGDGKNYTPESEH